MQRFVTYEHRDNGFDPAVMSEEEFEAGGRALVEEADAYIWQYAPDAETALAQHNDKHDEWSADMEAGREEKQTY